jgi:OOP family OmpA-OmpF porin
VTNALVVGAGGQSLLDKTLSNRVVEFELSAATLTPLGAAILDEMLEAIRQLNNPKLQIIGHTDSTGDRGANIALSLARATTVRSYLIAKGVPAGSLTAVGAGPDRPANSNDTVEGRAKNRRIEFSLMN